MNNNEKKGINYQNGKIYKIVSNQTDKIYIGSTSIPRLCDRMAQHRNNYRRFKNNKYHYVSSYEILQFSDNDIVLIENYPCQSKDELHSREEYWRKTFKDICVNKNHCINNKEDRLQIKRNWKMRNIQKVKEYNTERIFCETCAKLISRGNISTHTKSLIHQKLGKLENDIKITNKQYNEVILSFN